MVYCLTCLLIKEQRQKKKIRRLFLCIYALKQLTKEERKQLVTEPNVYEQIWLSLVCWKSPKIYTKDNIHLFKNRDDESVPMWSSLKPDKILQLHIWAEILKTPLLVSCGLQFDVNMNMSWIHIKSSSGTVFTPFTVSISSAVTHQTSTGCPVLAVTRAESPNSVAGSGSPCSARPLHRLRPQDVTLIGTSCVCPLTCIQGERAFSSCSMVVWVWGVESFSPAGHINNPSELVKANRFLL